MFAETGLPSGETTSVIVIDGICGIPEASGLPFMVMVELGVLLCTRMVALPLAESTDFTVSVSIMAIRLFIAMPIVEPTVLSVIW